MSTWQKFLSPVNRGTSRLGKPVQRLVGETKVSKGQRECWKNTAKLDTAMMNVLQVNKIVFFGGIFYIGQKPFS